ncbi:hypothetical protein pEaSNUABM14_00303 [Erwinia phage pEa_SNUABM_14]|uniref:Uncharacterized protein n=1 Tax=Erwinia phage pEa_SNUABM_7 TaxID=2866695 RepID=A0AAE8BKS9_9CAUD|nr:hypothetical protein MPK74_gp306 [Erwinia phage pEa_SNUABM_7]QYW04628.1 hypothetical protein pEaSNUABM14_00303 [Erwinia phage pEa_SNUABM_14]QYW04974.1 hypothetical protein pEaSNUABM7_00306 [Erwinia phage pEa_SNUABM_7]
MGVVNGISSTKFPRRGRDEGLTVILRRRWGLYPAVIVRQDHGEPNNTIHRIEAKALPKRFFDGSHELYVAEYYQTNFPKDTPICAAGEVEGLFVEIVFDHDVRNKCEGICVTDRGMQKIFLITTGQHEGRYVTEAECDYKVKPKLVKDNRDDSNI